MSSGDDLVCGETNFASDMTTLVGKKSKPSKDFTGPNVLVVGPQAVGAGLSPDRDINGVFGLGNRGGNGIVGQGGFQDRSAVDFGASGVVGLGGEGSVGKSGGTGVFGLGARGSRNRGGIGVHGVGGAGDTHLNGGPGVFGTSDFRDGVVGATTAPTLAGVFGFNWQTRGPGTGVHGECNSTEGNGVSGFAENGNGILGWSTIGYGVNGDSEKSIGVFGKSDDHIGVFGVSNTHIGVYATSPHFGLHADGGDAAMWAYSSGGHGVLALAPTPGKFAGAFGGDVVVFRHFTVLGAKSAAVREKGNTYRRFYSVESPESWFEDFGEAQLKNGRAVVRIPKDFAPFIRTNRYHVFVTPYGKCAGLAVTARNSKQFEVTELDGGKTKVRFSYRIVAKRADIIGKRLEKMEIEPLSKPPTSMRRTVSKRPERPVPPQRRVPKAEAIRQPKGRRV